MKKKKKKKLIDVEPTPASSIMSSMPKLPSDGSNPPPVLYKKGVIYTSIKEKRFRAMTVRGDRYSEIRGGMAWGKGAKPTKEHWKNAVRAIDASK